MLELALHGLKWLEIAEMAGVGPGFNDENYDEPNGVAYLTN